MPLYHFDIGNSSDSVIGMCAAIDAPDEKEAVGRLRNLLERLVGDCDELSLWSQGDNYVNIYLNPDKITELSIDDIDGEQVEEESMDRKAAVNELQEAIRHLNDHHFEERQKVVSEVAELGVRLREISHRMVQNTNRQSTLEGVVNGLVEKIKTAEAEEERRS